MVRMILASLVYTDILLLWCGGAITNKGRDVWKSAQLGGVRSSLVDHVSELRIKIKTPCSLTWHGYSTASASKYLKNEWKPIWK